MPKPRLKYLAITGYRSIGERVEITFPEAEPLVLIGENNAGKSNILRALNLVFGDSWPGSHKPEEHEFFGRDPEGMKISIVARTAGMLCDKCDAHSEITRISWTYEPDADSPCTYKRSASNCDHTYMSNAIRQDLFCMTVGVTRDLSYQLSYSSKWTSLAKLMRRFHERLVGEPDRVTKLKDIFKSVVDTFHEVKEFQSFGEALRAAFNDFGGNLRYGLGIDFSAYDPSNYFRSLRVFPHINGTPRTFEELGTGQEQVLAMAFAYAYAEAFGGDGLLLAIEEPESHLHPLAQQWLAQQLRKLAAMGVQVIITSHSPYFIDLSKPWTTALVRKEGEDQSTVVTQLKAERLAEKMMALGARKEVTSSESIGDFYDATATYETLGGFFARACVLVEGPTEQFALPELLGRAGLDLLRRGIAIISVEGISSMAKWARLYRAYGIPVYAIFDTDRDKSADKAATSHEAAKETLRAISDEADLQTIEGGLRTTPHYACFDPNYETVMKAIFPRYTELELEASQKLGKSKQFKAKYCARTLPKSDDELGNWDQIIELAKAIEALVPEDASTCPVEPDPPACASPLSRRAPRR